MRRRSARCFADLKCVPDKYLLWFHHLPWTYRMRDGGSLWDSLVERYDRGVAQVEANRREWAELRPYIDHQRFAAVTADLDRQVLEARWWRDASIAYWQSLAKIPFPPVIHLRLIPCHGIRQFISTAYRDFSARGSIPKSCALQEEEARHALSHLHLRRGPDRRQLRSAAGCAR